VSNAFFTALGRHLLQKQASRIPWATVLHGLRKKELLPGFVPRLPFIEPEPLPEPIGPAIPEEVIEELAKEEPALETPPKVKLKSGESEKSD